MAWDSQPRSRLAIGEVEREEEPETRRELLRSMMSLAEQVLKEPLGRFMST